MKKSIKNMMLDAVNLQIMQKIMFMEEASVKELTKALPEIPQSSIYRRIKELLEFNLIEVASETPVRGTVLKTYKIKKLPLGENPPKDVLQNIVQTAVLTISSEFNDYFEKDDVDVYNDCVDLSNAVVYISPEEYKELRQKIVDLVMKYMDNDEKKERKKRRILISLSPVNENGEEN